MSSTVPPVGPELTAAREAEMALRRCLADLASQRARAESEAGRLESRATMPGADAGLGAAATAQRSRAAALVGDIETARAGLRSAEGLVARLEAGI